MKKRIFTLITVFAMLLSANAYSAGSGGAGGSGYNLAGLIKDGMVTVGEIDAELGTVNDDMRSITIDTTLITSEVDGISMTYGVASYEEERLIDAKFIDYVVDPAVDSLDVTVKNGDTFKIMLWDSEHSIQPVALPLELPKSIEVGTSGAEISGLYKNIKITSEVGNGEVTLNNVELKGNLVIEGGGSNSIKLNNCSVGGKVVMSKEGGEAPRLLLTNTPVEKIEATKPAIIEAADAASAILDVEIKANLTVKGENTEISKITIPETTTDNVSISVESGAAVEDVTVNSSNGASITGEVGTISTDLETQPQNVTNNGNVVEHIHKWDNGTTTKEPTIREEGEKTYNCTGCDKTKTEKIPVLPMGDIYTFEEGEKGLRLVWPEIALSEGQQYLVTIKEPESMFGTTINKLPFGAFVAKSEVASGKISAKVDISTSWTPEEALYDEKEVANLTITDTVPSFTIKKDDSGAYKFVSDKEGGMWAYLVYNTSNQLVYSGNAINNTVDSYANLADGYTVKARYITWSFNTDKTFAEITATKQAEYIYRETNSLLSFRKWNTDIMFDGYEDVEDTKSLEVGGVKVVSSKAETMSEFLFEYDQTKGDISNADFVVELDGVEKERISKNVDVTLSNTDVAFTINTDGTLSFEANTHGSFAYKTTKEGKINQSGRIAFKNGTLVAGWTLPTLTDGETIDIMHIDCTYDAAAKAISATISKHTAKTYTAASEKNIWFSESEYGYPLIEWTPVELTNDELYFCNDMGWYSNSGYLYFELLNITENGYIPVTISKGTWEEQTPLYTENEAVYTTITDIEQNLSLVEESDGRYKITSHLNNFDAQCFVWQTRSKDGTKIYTGFTTGKITVSPYDNIEVVVRQVKWNISADKKQVEYIITPLYKITTYTDTQTPAEETYVSTYDDLKDALNKGGVVKLSADIKADSMLTLNTGDPAVLDLNGHTLDISRIETRNGKSLTINQTTSGSRLINSNGTQEVTAYYGDLTLNGGTYEKIGAQWANNITLNGIVGSRNDYSFYYGKNVSITDCTFGSDTSGSGLFICEAEKATIVNSVVYGENRGISFSDVNKAVVENTTITAPNNAISCQTNTTLELKNVKATAASETIRVHSGCNVTIDGGEYEVTNSYSNLMYMISGPTVTIKGGVFSGGNSLANPSSVNTGNLNISGGDFTCYTQNLLGKAMNCNISGGRFGYDISEYIEDSCTCTNNNDGTFTISTQNE